MALTSKPTGGEGWGGVTRRRFLAGGAIAGMGVALSHMLPPLGLGKAPVVFAGCSGCVCNELVWSGCDDCGGMWRTEKHYDTYYKNSGCGCTNNWCNDYIVWGSCGGC